MPEYIAVIKIFNKEIRLPVTLTGTHEDYPEDYFRLEKNQSLLRQRLQEQGIHQIEDAQLKKLIDEWIGDIKEGRKYSAIAIDLPPDAMTPPKTTIPPNAKPSDIFDYTPKSSPSIFYETDSNEAEF
ncbi:hypothetical protein [Argonema antarcticum]|uniref:hypothetical protein n=1 Tax=Argonema antarcticum TaxID=2942763 RepID=UPI00201208D3|nr:hypothetical protein [Argonema antarcticum]MCL1470931.1 hypothetical protein [Argonema antarcticum A004/B2]